MTRDIAAVLPESLAVLCLVALIWTSIWVALTHDYASAEEDAVHDTANLARAFEDNAHHIVVSIDQTLLALRAAFLANPDHFDLNTWEKRQNRPDRLTVQIGLIGPTGIVAGSTIKPSTPINVADREHFRVQLDPARDDLFISKPLLGRGTGRQTVQFTRKLLRPDGSFGGVAVVSMGCEELSKFYQEVDIGGGFVLLAGDDGIVRARGPLIEGSIGVDLHEREYFPSILAAREGSFRAAARSGAVKVLSFRRLDTYPLLVLVGFDEDRVLATFYATRQRWMEIGLVVTAAVVLLGICWIVQRRRSTASQRALQMTLDNMSQGIVMIDAGGRVPVMNARAAELLDLPAELPTALPGESDRRLAVQLGRIGSATAAGMLHRGGRLIEVQSHATAFGGVVLTYTDVTDRRRDEARILHLAHHDGLTGLANRAMLSERIAEAVTEAVMSNTHFAIASLDLDGFKAVNDGLGHDVGDLLLIRTAERLREAVRDDDTVARIGGDEFTILLRNLVQPETAEQIAQDLVRVLAEPMDIGGQRCVIGASVGLAVYPSDGTEAEDLLKNADIALYRAKEEGRGQCCRFETWMCYALEERRWLERELRICLEQNQLEVHFQPQFACDTLAVTGFEALARWRHPERGFISPATFIPIAEDCGLMIAIGRTVLEQACEMAATWHPRCRIAVNLSPLQFHDATLTKLLSDTLSRTGLAAGLLELEITEGVLICDEEQALSTLGALRDLGVRIALDDFGTGYSSLSYLRRFPFDKVKIDKSFVQAQQHDPRTRVILNAVLAMSSSLNLSVTAEGVETEEQLASLRAFGCSEVQGFLLGRPLPAAEIAGFLEAQKDRPDSAPPHLLGAFGVAERLAAIEHAA